MAALDTAISSAQAIQRDRESGQYDLFGDMGTSDQISGAGDNIPEMDEWDENVKLKFEKETIGFYITGHPLSAYAEEIQSYININLEELTRTNDRSDARICGVINNINEKITKRGDRMAFITLEDLTGTAEVIVFSDIYNKSQDILKGDTPVFIVGSLEKQEEEEKAKIIAREIMDLEQAKTKFTGLTKDQLHRLKNLVLQNRGDTDAFLHMIIPNKSETIMKLPGHLKVNPSRNLAENVDHYFGYQVTYFR